MADSESSKCRGRRRKPEKDFIVQIHRNNEADRLVGSKIKATMPPNNITYRFEDPAFDSWWVQIHLYERQP